MTEYLVEHGVPRDRLLVDHEGNTTKATAGNFKRLNFNVNAILVAQYYHYAYKAGVKKCRL